MEKISSLSYAWDHWYTYCTFYGKSIRVQKLSRKSTNATYAQSIFGGWIWPQNRLQIAQNWCKSTAFYICVRDSSVCLFLNKNIKHLARATEDHALVRFIGGSQRGSIAIPHRSSSYFLRCTSVRFSIARIFIIFTPKILFINLLKNI
jgi:hypothetical protein